jgi:ABC-2 type transport system ATP-binding protein
MNSIEIDHLVKRFKHFSLQDVSLQLPQGEIMGLIGANGAGKTTLIKIIMGLYLHDQGEVSVLGMDPVKDGNVLRNDIGFVFDDPRYYDFHLKKISRIIAPFYSNWDDELFYDYLGQFELSDRLKFKKLSRGMKLKFALAIALSHKAKLLVLDEPTSGLDPIFRIELLKILKKVKQEGTCSILFSSHITDDVERIADCITYIKKGRIIFSGIKEDILSRFLLIQGKEKGIPVEIASVMISGQVMPEYFEALLPREVAVSNGWNVEAKPSLEQIMLYHEMRDE